MYLEPTVEAHQKCPPGFDQLPRGSQMLGECKVGVPFDAVETLEQVC